jgi:hypothetical protein
MVVEAGTLIFEGNTIHGILYEEQLLHLLD